MVLMAPPILASEPALSCNALPLFAQQFLYPVDIPEGKQRWPRPEKIYNWSRQIPSSVFLPSLTSIPPLISPSSMGLLIEVLIHLFGEHE
uniref:Uncharacterized protein n=1 Tax=Yersinia enterocolitica TaxID=630 RepID=B0RKV6_YEREN|nr:hypothetical protein [Yersinia enterocolitica]